MELINQFKKTLLENPNGTSKVTVKNYLADVRKFVVWYEATYQRNFPPSSLPIGIVDAYLNPLRENSPRSAKRYQSSLRKFLSFMKDSSLIPYNPLAASLEAAPDIDVFRLRDFNNFLYNAGASPLTIKNYMADISQFVDWMSEANQPQAGVASPLRPRSEASTQHDLFAKIDTYHIEVYKNRLLIEAGLSPLSVNRKLSSLRKYIGWANNKGFLRKAAEVPGSIATDTVSDIAGANTSSPTPTEAPTLEDLALASFEEARLSAEAGAKTGDSHDTLDTHGTTAPGYSWFAPLRLMQKTKKGADVVFDAVFILSILKAVEFAKYNLWKTTGKEVFAPLPAVMKSLGHTAEAAGEAINIASMVKASPPTAIDKFITASNAAFGKGKIKSIPKSVYAPSSISLRALPFWGRLKYHIRYNRPNWYKKYHRYAFSHYLHMGIVLIVATFLGVRIYQAFYGISGPQTAFASRLSPNRLIAFQGRLNDASGSPLTQESLLRFAIYKSPTASGSALLWQETQRITPDATGSFATNLGKESPISQELFTQHPDLYLGISIGQDPELTPRHALASFGLSKNAQELQGLKPITGNNAGTENVILALDSSGNLTIGGSAAPIFQAIGGRFTLSGQELMLTTNPGSNSNIVLNPDGIGIIDVQKPLQNTSDNNNISTALGAVEIDDNLAILASTSAQSALVINQNSTGELISASTGDSAKFTVNNAGSGMFAGDLAIHGNKLETKTGTFSLANEITTTINIGGAATSVSIGGKIGTTAINHGLDVNGVIKAKSGIVLPHFTQGTIPFIGLENQIASDSANLFWDNTNKRLGLGINVPNKTLDVQGEIQTNLAGTQTSTALCGSHAAATGAIVADVTIVDCISNPTADYMEMYSTDPEVELGDIVTASTNYITTKDNDRLGRLKKSSVAYQASVIGIISDKSKAGDFNSVGHNIKDSDNPQPIALSGRVPVKMAASSSSIRPGDYLTTSNEPGKAMKAEKPGIVIGKALEAWDGSSGKSTLLVYVNLSWHDPRAVLMDDGGLATAYETPKHQTNPSNTDTEADTPEKAAKSSQNFVDTLKVGVLEVQKISTNSLAVATEDITIGTQTLREYISSIVNEILDKRLAEDNNKTIIVVSPLAGSVKAEASQPDTSISTASADLEPSPTPNASPSPTPVASISATYITNIYNTTSESPATPSASPTLSPTPSPSPSEAASVSATPSPTITPALDVDTNATASSTPLVTDYSLVQALTKQRLQQNSADIATFSAELAYVPNLKSDFATFDQGLIALGPTSLTDASINGQLSVGQSMIMTENSINTLAGDLNLQPLRQGNLSIMGGLVAIDTSGNLNVEGNANFAKDVTVRGVLATNVIKPVPDSELAIQLQGDVVGSGSARFANELEAQRGKFGDLKIVRGAQADTSFTETVASSSAGTAVITANETERTIITPHITADSLIYITPVSATYGVTPYIARQTIHDNAVNTRGSFTIQVSQKVTQDIKLNWWIIN